MTVDEFGSGCPVAFCFSSKCDEVHLSLFFEKVKEKVGVVTASVFMSDDAPAFNNVWSKVMSVPKHKLLCTWHVDKNWRKNLSKIKGGQDKKSLVYKTIKVLLQSLSAKEEFGELLSKTVSNLLNDPDTLEFGEYFVQFYCGRPEQWAYCFRQGLGINTNMYLESFHRSLKHLYLEGKKVKRLDKTINAVMKMARDSLFKRLIKLTKQTVSERVLRINKAHKASENVVSSAFVVSKEGEEWFVSSSNGKEKYTITKCGNICEENCMKCSYCNICIHSFKCTCHYNVIKMNICKHIHACCRVFSLTGSSPLSTVVDDDVNTLINQSNVKLNVQNNQKLKTKISTILNLLNKANISDDHFIFLEKKLDGFISALNNVSSDSRPSTSFACKDKVNVNEHIKPHVRLFSTKKKTMSLKRLKKPTYNESKNIVQGLLSQSEEIMNIHTEDDHIYSVSCK